MLNPPISSKGNRRKNLRFLVIIEGLLRGFTSSISPPVSTGSGVMMISGVYSEDGVGLAVGVSVEVSVGVGGIEAVVRLILGVTVGMEIVCNLLAAIANASASLAACTESFPDSDSRKPRKSLTF